MEMLTANKTKSLPASLSRLVNMLDEASLKEPLTPQKTKEIVLAADVQVEDMMIYADFDHPVEDCYGRNMVLDAGRFEVMVMSWNPGDYSSIHNHGYTEWGVVQVFGHTHHMLFNLKDGRLNMARKEILPSGTAIKVNNALIHQMGNATHDPYLTLHVYGSNNREEEVTADAKNYELEKNRVAHTTGGAFFNLPESEVYDFEPCVKPTQEVFMHYANLLMNYYNRQENTGEIIKKKQELFRQMQEWSNC